MRPERIWLFDLDDTLHDAHRSTMPGLSVAMGQYIERELGLSKPESDALRRRYFQRYGATLLGLMRHHGTDPRHFLHDTHQFPDLPRMVVFDNALRRMLARLPGRKIVFSNGPRHYAEAVLEIMGIRCFFVDVYAVEQMRFNPKPGLKAFHHLLKDHRLQASRCILVEDSAENLRSAKRLGMKTVWISRSLRQPPYVDVRLPSVLGLARHPVRRGASG